MFMFYFKKINSNEIFVKASFISSFINKWLGSECYEKISLGQNCNTSWYLKETGNKDLSYPFDWIFSSQEIVTDSIKDGFQSFLNKDFIFSKNDTKAGHLKYHYNLFNHKNPILDNNNYLYYSRCVSRFLDVLNSSEKSVLFVCTVIQEPNKRPDWSKGFKYDFPLPLNQNVKYFLPMITFLKSFKSNVKVIFISQYTNSSLNVELVDYSSDFIWIDFYSRGSNSGVKYLDNVDDSIVKILYNGMSNFNFEF